MTATTRPDLGIDWAIRCDAASGCPEWFGRPDAGLAQVRGMAEAEGWSRSVTMERLRDFCLRHKPFTGDLRGLSRAGRTGRVRAGGLLTDRGGQDGAGSADLPQAGAR
jgi:hypothetical protein